MLVFFGFLGSIFSNLVNDGLILFSAYLPSEESLDDLQLTIVVWFLHPLDQSLQSNLLGLPIPSYLPHSLSDLDDVDAILVNQFGVNRSSDARLSQTSHCLLFGDDVPPERASARRTMVEFSESLSNEYFFLVLHHQGCALKGDSNLLAHYFAHVILEAQY